MRRFACFKRIQLPPCRLPVSVPPNARVCICSARVCWPMAESLISVDARQWMPVDARWSHRQGRREIVPLGGIALVRRILSHVVPSVDSCWGLLGETMNGRNRTSPLMRLRRGVFSCHCLMTRVFRPCGMHVHDVVVCPFLQLWCFVPSCQGPVS